MKHRSLKLMLLIVFMLSVIGTIILLDTYQKSGRENAKREAILEAAKICGSMEIIYKDTITERIRTLFYHKDTKHFFAVLDRDMKPLHTKGFPPMLALGKVRGFPGDTVYLLKDDLRLEMIVLSLDTKCIYF